MKSKLFYFLTVLVSVASAGVMVAGQGAAMSAAAKKAALKQELQAKLTEWHAAGKAPGATLAVTLPDGATLAFAAGYVDREKKTRMEPNSRMLAGSVGKTFAAAVAVQLISEGKIGLDEKISKYLGDEEWFDRLPNARDITVRHLMTHTSGVIRYEFKPEFLKALIANPTKKWKPLEQIAFVFDDEAQFKAGEGWVYSDTNFIVLGMIMEKVTGRRFYDLADKRFVSKFKLKETTPSYGPKIEGLIQGYTGEGNPLHIRDEMIVDGALPFDPEFEWTGGGYVSTSGDLTRWAKLLYEGKALTDKERAMMLDGVAATPLGPETKYGLGVIIKPTPAGMTYGHSGFFPGYLTEMMYFPHRKFAVAMQVNSSRPGDNGAPMGRLVAGAAEAVTKYLQ